MEKDIGKITKNDTTDIVLRIDDFADKRGFTIREFVTSERYTGFTKAGVRILAKDWPKFKEMVNSVEDTDMAELGLEPEQKTLDKEVPEPPEEKAEESPKEESADEETSKEEEKESSEEKPSKEELPDY